MTDLELFELLHEEAKIIVYKNQRTEYAITKSGKVYSFKRKRYLNSKRSGSITIYMDGRRKTLSISRLVASYFGLENPDPKHFNLITHKDGDKLNNAFDNLEWTDTFGTKSFYNVNSKLSAEDRRKLKDDIKNSDMTSTQLNKKYNLNSKNGVCSRLCKKYNRSDKITHGSIFTEERKMEIYNSIVNRDKNISIRAFVKELAKELGCESRMLLNMYNYLATKLKKTE